MLHYTPHVLDMQCLLLLALLVSSAAATVGIEPSQHATSNSTSQLLYLTLTPHLERLVPLPTAQSVSPDSEEAATSPADINPLAELALRNEEKEEEEPLEAQQPESCIQGVAEEPCPLMDVQHRCGSALPVGIDRALNYTFLQARFSLTGANCASRALSPLLSRADMDSGSHVDPGLPGQGGEERAAKRDGRRGLLRHHLPERVQEGVGSVAEVGAGYGGRGALCVCRGQDHGPSADMGYVSMSSSAVYVPVSPTRLRLPKCERVLASMEAKALAQASGKSRWELERGERRSKGSRLRARARSDSERPFCLTRPRDKRVAHTRRPAAARARPLLPQCSPILRRSFSSGFRCLAVDARVEREDTSIPKNTDQTQGLQRPGGGVQGEVRVRDTVHDTENARQMIEDTRAGREGAEKTEPRCVPSER